MRKLIKRYERIEARTGRRKSKQRKHPCPICSMLFINELAVGDHLRDVHNGSNMEKVK